MLRRNEPVIKPWSQSWGRIRGRCQKSRQQGLTGHKIPAPSAPLL